MGMRSVLAMILFANFICGCNFQMFLPTPVLPKGKYLQVRYPPNYEVGLQVGTQSDDECDFLLLSNKSTAGRPPENMTCSEASASQSLRYQATIKKGSELIEIETSSLSLCKSFADDILNAPTQISDHKTKTESQDDLSDGYAYSRGEIKGPESYEEPAKLAMAAECGEKG